MIYSIYKASSLSSLSAYKGETSKTYKHMDSITENFNNTT